MTRFLWHHWIFKRTPFCKTVSAPLEMQCLVSGRLSRIKALFCTYVATTKVVYAALLMTVLLLVTDTTDSYSSCYTYCQRSYTTLPLKLELSDMILSKAVSQAATKDAIQWVTSLLYSRCQLKWSLHCCNCCYCKHYWLTTRNMTFECLVVDLVFLLKPIAYSWNVPRPFSLFTCTT